MDKKSREQRPDIYEKKQQIQDWIQEGQPKCYIAKQLGCDQKTLRTYLSKMGIDYAGNRNPKGRHRTSKLKQSLSYYLENSKSPETNKIRRKILEENVKPHQCECCKNTEWHGNPIPLELHHIDGNKKNNSIDNLQLLCPNCHAFTDNYRGKNVGKNK